MPINFSNREITAISYANRAIAAVYYGTRIVWQAIRSCFGAGFWVNEKPWLDTEGWKN